MKTLVFDMDGTIADFYNYPNWVEHLKNKSAEPYENALPFYDMEEMKEVLLSLKSRYRIVVTTWVSKSGMDYKYHMETCNAKMRWLENYNFPYDLLVVTRYGELKEEFSKKFHGEQILIDDNEEVRKTWTLGPTFDAHGNVLEFLKSL